MRRALLRRIERLEGVPLPPRVFSVLRAIDDDRPLAALVAEKYDGAVADDADLIIERVIVAPKERMARHGR